MRTLEFIRDETIRTDIPVETHLSPSGKYRLVITCHATTEGGWSYSHGLVYEGERVIGDIHRNYPGFPFAWIEGHPNTGHDYLVCGEDYQGQTVIELDTGERQDYLPPGAKDGGGFCWVLIEPDEDGWKLRVEGCFWACGFEAIEYDFADPLNLPYPELSRRDIE